MSLIYLDFLTTTPTAPSVVDAMLPYFQQHYLLPLQSHPQAAAVGDAIEAAREKVAEMLAAEAAEVVLTGGGTEANVLGLVGSMHAMHPPGTLRPQSDDRSPRLLLAAGEGGGDRPGRRGDGAGRLGHRFGGSGARRLNQRGRF